LGEFTIFGTTADAGLELRAESLEDLFATAVEGFASLLVENPSAVRPGERREISIRGEDEGELLVSLLNELIFLFDADHWLPRASEKVELSQKGLAMVLVGESFDSTIHHLSGEIKAATYHQAVVIRDGKGWLGRVIVDL